MKRIVKTTENYWQCPYCGYLNDLSEKACKQCGATRSGDEVEKKITTDLKETTIESTEDSKPIIENHVSTKIILAIVLLAVALIAGIFAKSHTTDKDQFIVLSKQWEYTISIGKFVEEKGITSYTQPPHGATNITTKQVQQDNGWYKTEYTYDYQDWKVVRTERVTGESDYPTFEEFTPNKDEKVMNTSEVTYMVTIQSINGVKTISVSQDRWISIVVGNTYSESDF